MKTNLPSMAATALLRLAILIGIPLSATAQTTAFTYQGKLEVSGAPATGTYDFNFQVFDALTGGSSIGGTVPVNGVVVSQGYFAVTVDFGSAPFTGSARWLQISVSTNGAGSFSTLSPRQALSPTPYAVFANTAATVPAGAIASAQLAADSVATASLQNNAVTTAKIASGQVVKSLNGLTDAVSLTQGANVTINTVGNSLEISAPAGGLALPYSGATGASAPAFVISNSLYGNFARLGTADFGVEGISLSTADWGVKGLHQPTANYGALGLADSGAFGVSAASGNYGQLGTMAYGVYGQHTVSNNIGVLGDPVFGVFGIHGASQNRGGLGTATEGVFGLCPLVDQPGSAVRGTNSWTGAWGAFGHNRESGINQFFGTGVYGEFTDPSEYGAAVYGRDRTSGAFGALGYRTAWLLGDFQVGVYGNDGGDTNNLAGSFWGDVAIDFGGLYVSDDVYGQSFIVTSDRNRKENFTQIRPETILEKVAALPISRWNFKGDKAVQHIGPMAQDFHAAFGLSADDKRIGVMDAAGVALAAIQGLNQKLEAQRVEMKRKDAQIEELRAAVAELKAALQPRP